MATIRSPSSGEGWLSTPRFEHGLGGWRTSSETSSVQADNDIAHNPGVRLCGTLNCHDRLAASVSLPTPAQQVFLSFRYKVATGKSSDACTDRLLAELRTTDDQLIYTSDVICNQATHGWTYRRIDAYELAESRQPISTPHQSMPSHIRSFLETWEAGGLSAQVE